MRTLSTQPFHKLTLGILFAVMVVVAPACDSLSSLDDRGQSLNSLPRLYLKRMIPTFAMAALCSLTMIISLNSCDH